MKSKTKTTDPWLACEMGDLKDAAGVWRELEEALQGENGYGGNVAEIYGYRLLPPGPLDVRLSESEEEARGQVVAAGLMKILRRFRELHPGCEFRINGAPLDVEEGQLSPFTYRVHVEVTAPGEADDHPETSECAYHRGRADALAGVLAAAMDRFAGVMTSDDVTPGVADSKKSDEPFRSYYNDACRKIVDLESRLRAAQANAPATAAARKEEDRMSDEDLRTPTPGDLPLYRPTGRNLLVRHVRDADYQPWVDADGAWYLGPWSAIVVDLGPQVGPSLDADACLPGAKVVLRRSRGTCLGSEFVRGVYTDVVAVDVDDVLAVVSSGPAGETTRDQGSTPTSALSLIAYVVQIEATIDQYPDRHPDERDETEAAEATHLIAKLKTMVAWRRRTTDYLADTHTRKRTT